MPLRELSPGEQLDQVAPQLGAVAPSLNQVGSQLREIPAASRVVGASARARAPPMDYLYDLRRASPKGSTLHANRGSMFNAD